MASIDLNETLKQIVSGGHSSPFIQIAKTTESGPAPDVAQTMLKVFEAAFPDMSFDIVSDKEGKQAVRGVQKQQPANTAESVPQGLDPKLVDKGIADLQKALSTAVSDEEKLNIAVRLKAAVDTAKAFKFNQYKEIAEAEFGIPDMVQAISRVQQAEAASPYNPGTGMPSMQRLQLLETLGIARVRASNRVKELSDSDTSLVGAANLASATILEIEKGMQLAGKASILEARDAARLAKETAIGSMNPDFIQNVSILKNATPNPTDAQRRAIAEGIYDKKINLTETERVLATASPDSLKGLYVTVKDPKHKEQVLQLLEAKELAITGDAQQAKRNLEVFKKAYSIDVADLKATGMPELSDRARRKASENVARYPDKSARDQVSREDRIAFQNEYLANVVTAAFTEDVGSWTGVIQSDDTAKAVLRQMKITNPKDVNMRKFITNYLMYNDGKNLDQKSKAIQAITASAMNAFTQSVVLPIPSEESIGQLTQRMLAAAYVTESVRTAQSPIGSVNIFRTP